jgi:hypothetical protein
MIRFSGIALLSLHACACGGDVNDERPGQTAQPSESALRTQDAADHTTADLQALRYLDGDWRGSGYEGGPFYESYRFVNDSTIEMTAWTDSTMTAEGKKSQYMLRDGVIRTSDGARLVSVDEDGHHFQGPSSRWTFKQVSPDRWTARVGPSTIYTMDRIAKP